MSPPKWANNKDRGRSDEAVMVDYRITLSSGEVFTVKAHPNYKIVDGAFVLRTEDGDQVLAAGHWVDVIQQAAKEEP